MGYTVRYLDFHLKAKMATQLEKELPTDEGYFQQTLPQYYRSVLKKFCKISRGFVHFNLLFISIFLVEIVAFVISIPFLNQSMMIALSLSALFLTCFSYCVLLFYFQANKPEQLVGLKEDFLQSCRRLLSTPPGVAEHHLTIAEAMSRLSQYLQDFEWEFYKVPSFFQFCSPAISRLSAYFYWEDVFRMKQLLLTSAIEEHLLQIRVTPTDLEVHASLASTFVLLSKLYREPLESIHHPRSGRLKKMRGPFEEKSDQYSRLAIEEFKILSQYASNDPWVHEQMAMGYKDLKIVEEEIKEVEILLKLRPQDKEILFRLGSLYFSQGLNAKGLQVYEELKRTNFKKAEDLISSYGSYTRPS